MRFRTHRALGLLLVAALTLICVSAEAKEAQVTLKSGRLLRGQVAAETDESVTLIVNGQRKTIARSDIRDYKPIATIDEEYKSKRSEIDDDDLNGRYKLALWLYDKRAFDLAVSELGDLRKQFPQEARVGKRLEKAEAQLKASQKSREREDEHGDSPDKDAKDGRISPKWPVFFTKEQINTLRVFEVDLATRPAVLIRPKTIDRLLLHHADEKLRGDTNQRQFRALKGYQQLEHIFSMVERDPEVRKLYEEVVIRKDPPAFATFRSRIHRPFVINYCGSAKCHGDAKYEGLRLIRAKPTRPATVYTNFYILDSYNIKDSKYDMIDRRTPAKSLFVQYGMRRTDAENPHPEAGGWKALFRTKRDRRMRMLVNWIPMLQNPRPKYTIEFPPKVKPDTDGDAGEKKRTTPVR